MPQIPAHPRPNGHQKWRDGHARASEQSPSSGRWVGVAVLASLAFWIALGLAGAKMLGAF